MATPKRKVQIGDIVYRSFEPKKPGRVVNIVKPDLETFRKGRRSFSHWTQEQNEKFLLEMLDDHSTVTVQTAKGETFECEARMLNDFRALVDETQKKADNHRARLQALEAMS